MANTQNANNSTFNQTAEGGVAVRSWIYSFSCRPTYLPVPEWTEMSQLLKKYLRVLYYRIE